MNYEKEWIGRENMPSIKNKEERMMELEYYKIHNSIRKKIINIIN